MTSGPAVAVALLDSENKQGYLHKSVLHSILSLCGRHSQSPTTLGGFVCSHWVMEERDIFFHVAATGKLPMVS